MAIVAATEEIRYQSERTAYAFHCDPSFVRGIMGPFGSGKSVACCMEIAIKAAAQAPYNGVRRSRWAVIRNTYPELKSTTIKTWTDWFPASLCRMVYGSPITGYLRMPAGDGTIIEAEIIFLALDLPKDVKKLLSLELTGAWINEAREIDEAVIDAVTARVGRYPSKRQGGPTWSGIILDTNPPNTRHWWYRKFELLKPDGWRLFRQPPALLRDGKWYRPNDGTGGYPPAENVQHQPLGFNYWLRQLAGKDPEWIKVYIMGEYGNVFAGLPVYRDIYSDELHWSPLPLPVFRGVPLLFGWDFGNTPACIIAQVTPGGRLHVLREALCTKGGIRQFATDTVLPLVAREFQGIPIHSWGDPAGVAGTQVDNTESPIKELGILGIPTEPAKTNDFTMRREAVLYWLTRMIDGRPAFRLDPSCVMLREGFLGGYSFARVQVNEDLPRYRDVPVKNEYSHPHDGLQYLALHAKGTTMATYTDRPSAQAQAGGWKGRV